VNGRASASTRRPRNSANAFHASRRRSRSEWGTRPDGDRRVWKFDPLHQTRSPQPASVAQARAFWRRVRCPVLYVERAESTLRLTGDDVAERLAALRAERTVIAGAGHHPHLEQPAALADVLIAFLERAQGGPGA
jgi:pimeloyl-ACP methyl ester carboxylesterase